VKGRPRGRRKGQGRSGTPRLTTPRHAEKDRSGDPGEGEWVIPAKANRPVARHREMLSNFVRLRYGRFHIRQKRLVTTAQPAFPCSKSSLEQLHLQIGTGELGEVDDVHVFAISGRYVDQDSNQPTLSHPGGHFGSFPLSASSATAAAASSSDFMTSCAARASRFSRRHSKRKVRRQARRLTHGGQRTRVDRADLAGRDEAVTA